MGVSRSGPQKANVLQWAGDTPNALVSGRVPSIAQVVSDKTGYSLTAGSYVGRASSSQHILNSLADTIGFQNIGISTITIIRATMTETHRLNNTVINVAMIASWINATGTFASQRQSATDIIHVQGEITELF